MIKAALSALGPSRRGVWFIISPGLEPAQIRPTRRGQRQQAAELLSCASFTHLPLSDDIYLAHDPDATEPNLTARELGILFGAELVTGALCGTVIVTGTVHDNHIDSLSAPTLAHAADLIAKAVDVAIPYWHRRLVLPTRGTTNGRRSTWNPRDEN